MIRLTHLSHSEGGEVRDLKYLGLGLYWRKERKRLSSRALTRRANLTDAGDRWGTPPSPSAAILRSADVGARTAGKKKRQEGEGVRGIE